VTLGAEVVALILVESKIELGTVLNYRTVERRQQNVVLIIKLRYGNNEQTVIFARIAVYKSRCTIGARTVCSQQFTMERLLKIGHYSFLES
jgi:CRP-like cAMP-binding protein